MSRQRVYVDGRPAWSDLGPAFARRQGFGGSAMGAYSGTVLAVGPSKAVRVAAQARRAEVRRLYREKHPDMRRNRVRA